MYQCRRVLIGSLDSKGSLMGGRSAVPFVAAEVFCCAVVVVARGVDLLGGTAISVPVPMPIPALL